MLSSLFSISGSKIITVKTCVPPYTFYVNFPIQLRSFFTTFNGCWLLKWKKVVPDVNIKLYTLGWNEIGKIGTLMTKYTFRKILRNLLINIVMSWTWRRVEYPSGTQWLRKCWDGSASEEFSANILRNISATFQYLTYHSEIVEHFLTILYPLAVPYLQ